MEQTDQQNAFRENRRVLQHFGWRCSIDGTGHTWFCSEETNQWSREFPLFALLSSDLKQEVHRMFTQPAPRPSPSRHPSITTSAAHRATANKGEKSSQFTQCTRGSSDSDTPVFWSLCDICSLSLQDTSSFRIHKGCFVNS